MLASLVLVVVASTAVRSRHLAHSDIYADQLANENWNAYGQLEGSIQYPAHGLAPKTNLNRAHQQADHISDRKLNRMVYPSEDEIVSKFGNQYMDNELDGRDSKRNNMNNYMAVHTDNDQLSNVQGQGHEMRSDRQMYGTAKHETTHRGDNTRIKSTVGANQEPVTERRLFTNGPTRANVTNNSDGEVWIWSDTETTTLIDDLEDKANFSVDNCSTGQVRVRNICVESH